MSAKKKLKTSAMIASIAGEGQPVTAAPFGHALVEAAEKNPKIVGMTADLGKYTDLHIFAQAYPDRYYQMGMAEQLLMMAGAGMAREGFIPFVTTYSVFASRRAYDFICLAIAEEKLNVKIIGGLPGLTTGYGPSHQATEDIAIFRGMPNLTIIDPCDAVDIEQSVQAMADYDGPVYLRLLRGKVPRVLDRFEDYHFEIGKAKRLMNGQDALIISSGLMTTRAIEAADELKEKGIEVAVMHCATVKPLDTDAILAEVRSIPDRPVFVAENHSVIGGLGESIASLLMKEGVAVKFHQIGLPDEFLDAGALPTLHDRYGISTREVVKAVAKNVSVEEEVSPTI
ncbi:transketolase family protein [Vreelandella aquamarina]|uniref:transketolase family protein n=1 Tax=Vreelandella aquamarina TaxID=77097 RepID=UPI00384D1687